MDNMDALRTHFFSEAMPHSIKRDGKCILHRKCLSCGRDFAQGLNGGGWRAAYIGVLRIELLAESVNRRWLTEKCPRSLLPADNEDRAMRAPQSERSGA
jgi:hypothetical protein